MTVLTSASAIVSAAPAGTGLQAQKVSRVATLTIATGVISELRQALGVTAVVVILAAPAGKTDGAENP